MSKRQAIILAGAGGLPLIVLWVLQTWPPPARFVIHEPTMHVVLIVLATIVSAALGAMALRTYASTGSIRSRALAAALLTFAAIYVWHGVYTLRPPPFAFLIYGPASRLALAMALPLLLSRALDPTPLRYGRMVTVLGGAVGVAAIAGAIHPWLATWALGATASEMQTVRLIVESAAGILALTSGLLLLRDMPSRRDAFEPAVVTAVLLMGGQSIYFIVATPWTFTWWLAHAIGGASSVVLALAVLAHLQRSERLAELARVQAVADMKTRFINAAAHELFTPMTPIRLQMATLRRIPDPLSPRQAHALEVLERNVTRLSELANSILEGVRTQASTLPVNLETIDVDGALAEIVESYQAVAQENGIELTMKSPGGLRGWTDRPRLQQIVANFISNALKNTRDGGRVIVRASEETEAIRIDVTDDGRGLSLEETSTLFQPFIQLEDASREEGTGLGLYITRQLAERLNGRVGVDSPGLGKGCTFFITIPTSDPGRPSTPPDGSAA